MQVLKGKTRKPKLLYVYDNEDDLRAPCYEYAVFFTINACVSLWLMCSVVSLLVFLGVLTRCLERFLVLSTVSKGAILARRTENIVTLSTVRRTEHGGIDFGQIFHDGESVW